MVKRELKIGRLIVKPGQLGSGFIKGVELDFSEFNIPIIVANGKHDGPILSITAVVHGTEISGIEVIRKVLREKIDMNELHGAVVAVTVCNPLGFSWHEHSSPQDKTNMSMVFPGDANGSLTQKLAYKVWTEAVLKSQYNIDIHHNGWPAIPYILSKSEIAKDKETGQKSLEMAKATGLTLMHQGKAPFWGSKTWGSLTDATMKEGIPSVTVELNAPMGRIVNDIVDVGVRSVLNVMKCLNMIPGKLEKHPKSVRVLSGEFVFKVTKFPHSTRGGIMIMEKNPGDFIKKGEKIATIYNVFGEKLEEVKMTVDGYIWSYNLNSLVYEGSYIACIFAEWHPELAEEESESYGTIVV